MGVHFKENEEKITLGMIITSIFIIGILTAGLIVYFINMKSDLKEEHIIGEAKEQEDDFESVSIDIGKSINEAQNELNTTTSALVENEKNKEDESNGINTNIANNESKDITQDSATKNNSENSRNIIEETNASIDDENTKEIKFIAPLNGKIIREFALDSLVYSETLEEWITHNGVDIAASKTTVVKSVASGTVYAIKNDPRYGLTVIINHEDGYQSIYANLLTAEYVVEGEKIEEGQTIGTVGNSATFEIADEYHLHFELLKEGEYVNPTNYINF